MSTKNPLLTDWSGPFALPPFERITDDHFAPAIDKAFKQSRCAINDIADNSDAPSFANTIDALECADELMEKVLGVFFNLSATDSNDAKQALQRNLAPRFAAFSSETMMNRTLFKRIVQLNENREGNTAEQNRVLDLYHRMFVRAGASLTGDAKKRLPKITARLAELGTAFTQNLLKDEADWFMKLGANDLDGLPGFFVSASAQAAGERGVKGHIITLSRSIIVPFLQFSTRRDLREKAYVAWGKRGENGGKTDNRAIIKETLDLRYERAKLLGYRSFADFKLEPEMAKTPQNVRDLLLAVWEPARNAANADAARLTEMMHNDGINADLEPWDWRYYAEKLRSTDFGLDEAELKPYFQLDQMIEAAFDCANRLFGLTFHPLDVPLYHPDVRLWEVKKDNRHMAVFIGDYFARTSKRSGAWCSQMRSQSNLGQDIRPVTINVCNFAKAPPGQPSLLTFDDARTLFHEFGHALHSMLSDTHYPMISGTSVARDFVELPSQLFEHWLSVPSVLERYALHAQTNEPIPKTLIDKLRAAENFDIGFSTVEYTASALVDLTLHEGKPPADPMTAQSEILDQHGMPNAIRMRHAAPHFAHVFSGDGYSSAYYSYMWSEVMDADAFAAFEEAGNPFDPQLAAKLHQHIYSAGGSMTGEELYLAFRGSLPKVDALLKGRGLDT